VKIHFSARTATIIGKFFRLFDAGLIAPCQIFLTKNFNTMWKKTLTYLSVAGALYSCDLRNTETARLQTQVDSLKMEIESNHKTTETLQEIGTLMDSIDASRSLLKTKMVEGTTFADYTVRMRDISRYVKEAVVRIEFLEDRVVSLKNSTSSYTGTIKKLKADLETRNQELTAFQEQVDKYRNQNDNLVQTVGLQKAEITDKLGQIEVKQQEIAKLENRVKDLLAESKIDEAESYFARARAVEETAKRTRFAPRRKRETRKEALELYKMAAFYGKEEANEKVTELEKLI
jgi:chromosome segregation ATPase